MPDPVLTPGRGPRRGREAAARPARAPADAAGRTPRGSPRSSAAGCACSSSATTAPAWCSAGTRPGTTSSCSATRVAEGCDMVVWGARVQSNNCRQTAAGVREARPRVPAVPEPRRTRRPSRREPAARLPRRGEGRVHRRDDRPGTERAARGEGRGVPPSRAEAVLLGPAAGGAAGGGQLRPVRGRDRGADSPRWSRRRTRSTSRPPGATGAGVALGKALLGLDVPGPAHLPDALAVAHPDAHGRRRERRGRALGLPHRLTPADIDADESYVVARLRAAVARGREALHLLATQRRSCSTTSTPRRRWRH